MSDEGESDGSHRCGSLSKPHTSERVEKAGPRLGAAAHAACATTCVRRRHPEPNFRLVQSIRRVQQLVEEDGQLQRTASCKRAAVPVQVRRRQFEGGAHRSERSILVLEKQKLVGQV
eukprot:2746170-Prymnesium_polylepis.2